MLIKKFLERLAFYDEGFNVEIIDGNLTKTLQRQSSSFFLGGNESDCLPREKQSNFQQEIKRSILMSQ